MPDGPWAKYAEPQAAAAGPWAKYQETKVPEKGLGERLYEFATEGQKHIFTHQVPQLAAGVVGPKIASEIGIPAAATPEDEKDRTSGSELLLGTGARQPIGSLSRLAPPPMRAGSWSNVQPAARASGVDPVAAVKSAAQNPAAQTIATHLANYGMGGAAVGATLALLKKLGLL